MHSVKQGARNEVQDFDPDFVIKLHNRFNMHYGWIPLKEFLRIPIPTALALSQELNAELKRQNEAMTTKRR